MIRALEWAESFPENMPEKTGQDWAMEFVKNLAESKQNQNRISANH